MATAKNHHSPYDLDKTNAYSLFTCVKARHKLSKFPFRNDVAEPDKIPASLTWPNFTEASLFLNAPELDPHPSILPLLNDISDSHHPATSSSSLFTCLSKRKILFA